MNADKFGAFIAACRKEQHMTQLELAQKLQVTDKAVSRWERGKGFPDISMLIPLSEALEITVTELMRSEKGRLLLRYLTDFMVEVSTRGNANAEWIKGMGMLINHLKEIDEICQKLNEEKRR